MTIRVTRRDSGTTVKLTDLVPKLAGRRVEHFDVPHDRQRERYKKKGWL